MTYESIDWNAEAARVKAAFGFAAHCKFIESESDEIGIAPTIFYRQLIWQDGRPFIEVPIQKGGIFNCKYYADSTFEYAVDRTDISNMSDADTRFTLIAFGIDGPIYLSIALPEHAHFLSKGLFHLGLLTPEVEVALKVSITAHQKLEWKLEYEAKYHPLESEA